jgi:hypothetical protein
MARTGDPDDRPGSGVPFEKSDRVVNDLNVAYEQLKALIAAWVTISSTPTFRAIRREFLGR